MSLVLFVSLLGPAAPDDAREARVRREFDRLQGTWDIIRFEEGGETLDIDDPPPSFALVIKGRALTVGKDKGELTIDPDTDPKLLDIHYTEVKFTLETIYELKDDTFRICFRPGTRAVKERPTSFSTKDHPGWHVRTYRRARA